MGVHVGDAELPEIITETAQSLQLTLIEHGPLMARQVVFPCKTPLLHPYQLLSYQAQILPLLASQSPQNRIVYIADESTYSLKNQLTLLTRIRSLITPRDHQLELIVFRANEWKYASQIASLFNSARAVIGVHSYQFDNIIWCRPGTVIHEIGRAKASETQYFQMARILGHEYLYTVGAIDPSKPNVITIDSDAVLSHFFAWLDRSDRESSIHRSYDWTSDCDPADRSRPVTGC